MRNKRRVVVALYHRDRLSLGDNRAQLQHRAYHWAIIIMPKSPNQHNNCNVYDATDTAMIDPNTRQDLNPNLDWRFRIQHLVDPSATGRLIGRIVVGKLPNHTEDAFIAELLGEVPLPAKDASPPQSCVTWAFDALSLLQKAGFAREFQLKEFRHWAVAYGDQCMKSMAPNNICDYPPGRSHKEDEQRPSPSVR